MEKETLQLDYNLMKEEAISLLQDLIRNKCVNYERVDSGYEIRSVETLKTYFSKYDITDYEVFEPEKDRASLLLKIEGSDPNAKSLMYESHLDVVPVNEDNWEEDPFSGLKKDGFIWGRGAMDMLIFTATQAVTFAHLISSGWKPRGDFYFLAVADEEGGGRYGAKWLVENVPDKIKADYLIGEFGGSRIDTPKGPKIGLMIAEKGPGWSKLTVKGTPGHGSLPYKSDNALVKLSKIVTKLNDNPPSPVITPEWKNFISGLELGKFSKFLLTNKYTVNLAIKLAERKDPGLAKAMYSLTRMTISPNIGQAGNKVNIIPDEAELSIDVRMLPGQNQDDLINYLKRTLGSDLWEEVEFQPKIYLPGSSDPWNNEFVSTIKKIHQKLDPSSKVEPMILPAVTDARFFRQIGIKCYGFCELSNKVDLSMLMSVVHGNNERVPLEAIEQSTQFFTELALDFL